MPPATSESRDVRDGHPVSEPTGPSGTKGLAAVTALVSALLGSGVGGGATIAYMNAAMQTREAREYETQRRLSALEATTPALMARYSADLINLSGRIEQMASLVERAVDRMSAAKR